MRERKYYSERGREGRERERRYFRFNINIYFLNKKRGKSVFSKRVQKKNEEDTLWTL